MTKPFGAAELLARIRSALAQLFPQCRIRQTSGRSSLWCRIWRSCTTPDRSFIKRKRDQAHPDRVQYRGTAVRALWQDDDAIRRSSKESGATRMKAASRKLQVNMANIRKKFGVKPGRGNLYYQRVGRRLPDEQRLAICNSEIYDKISQILDNTSRNICRM